MKIKLGILFISIVLTAVLKICWFTIVFFLIAVVIVIQAFSVKKTKYQQLNKAIFYTLWILIIFIIAIFSRVFLFEIYKIPSTSMEDTYFPGDVILESKLMYGPKLPSSPNEIPWVKIFYSLFTSNYQTNDSFGTYKRLYGISNVRRNDIIVFKMPYQKHETLVKRCIGLPNEVLTIKNGQLYINGIFTKSFPTVKQLYTVWLSDNKVAKRRSIIRVLNIGDKESLLNHKSVDSLSLLVLPSYNSPRVFPYNNNFNWTLDNYGPIQIPGKGLKIKLNENSYSLFKYILYQYENVKITISDGKFFIDGKVVREYVFKKNYYFMMGDNRYDSKDSRFWGFLPEENIEGKAVCTLFSNSNS